MPAPRQHRGEDRDRVVDLGVGHEQRRGEAQGAAGVTALTISPDSIAPLRHVLGVDPGRELGGDQQPEAAHLGDAVDLGKRSRAARRPARRVREPARVP